MELLIYVVGYADSIFLGIRTKDLFGCVRVCVGGFVGVFHMIAIFLVLRKKH